MLNDTDLQAALKMTVRQNNYLRRHGFFGDDDLQQIDDAMGPGNNVFVVDAPAADGSRMYIVVSYPQNDAAACKKEAERVAGICAENGITVSADELHQRFWTNDFREDIIIS